MYVLPTRLSQSLVGSSAVDRRGMLRHFAAARSAHPRHHTASSPKGRRRMHRKCTGLLMLGALAVAACQENAAPTADSNDAVPALTKSATPLAGTPAERAAQIAERINARLAGAGRTVRLDGA